MTLCPVEKDCGGCGFLGVMREAELADKLAMTKEVLSEFAGEIEIHCGSSRVGYRNRLRMAVQNGVADFYNTTKRNGCSVLVPQLQSATDALRAISARNPGLLAGVNHVELRVSGQSVQVGLAIYQGKASPQRPQIENALGQGWLVDVSNQPKGAALQYKIVGDLLHDVGLFSFVQVNSEVSELIVKLVLNKADQAGCSTFLDLYCGAGNYALALASNGLTGTAVENNDASLQTLRGHKLAARVNAVTADAQLVLDELPTADLIVINPPRAGLKQLAASVADKVTSQAIYVSCNQGSLSKDLRTLVAKGLTVKSIDALDMFPGTPHVETVVHLERS